VTQETIPMLQTSQCLLGSYTLFLGFAQFTTQFVHLGEKLLSGHTFDSHNLTSSVMKYGFF
jgi:hypothetical protein